MKVKRFVALLFACCLSLSLATTSFAIEKVPLIPEDQITRASTVPTTHKNLGAGPYVGELVDLAPTKASLTRYYFTTGTGKINMEFDLERSGTTTSATRVLRVYLYEKTGENASWRQKGGSTTVSFSGSGINTTRSFTGLNPDYFYYLKFANESNAEVDSRWDISGEIIISE